jgi:hypothetical protein
VRRHEHIRLSPADRVTLPAERYDLRGRDGKLICTVTRDRAQAGIASGVLELWSGTSGAYLRAVGLSYPEFSRAPSRPVETWPSLPRGAVPPPVRTHKGTACGQVGGHRAHRVGPASIPPAA